MCLHACIVRHSDGMLAIDRYTFAGRAVTDTKISALPVFLCDFTVFTHKIGENMNEKTAESTPKMILE